MFKEAALYGNQTIDWPESSPPRNFFLKLSSKTRTGRIPLTAPVTHKPI